MSHHDQFVMFEIGIGNQPIEMVIISFAYSEMGWMIFYVKNQRREYSFILGMVHKNFINREPRYWSFVT